MTRRKHILPLFHYPVVKTTITIFLLVIIIALFLISALHHYPAVIDDAYISFRYSAHFANGEGLVYNPGDRVEGFSNFLWTLIIGIAMKLFQVDAMFFSKILGMLATIGLIIALYIASRMIMGRWHIVNFVPSFIIAVNTYLAHWSVMGLATSAFTFLIFMSIFVAFIEQKHHWRIQISPFIAALTIMTRIDGSFFLGIIFPVFWIILLSRGELKPRRFALWVFQFAIILIPYELWRYFYYDSLFPNPYYAKVDPMLGHSRGKAHLFYFFFTQGWGFMNLWLVPAVVALFWRNRYGIICLVMLLLICFFVWYVNGDWMPNYRFLLPILPFMALNIVVVARLVSRMRFLPIKVLLFVLLGIALYDYGKFHFNEKSVYVFDWNPHRYYKNDKRWFYPETLAQNLWQGIVPPLQNVADWIFHNVPDGAQVMTSDIGYPGFLNLGVRIIDIDGLTDRFIGRAGLTHESHIKRQEYIMNKKPEFIFIFINHTSQDPNTPGAPYPDVSRLIYNSPEFKQDYEEVEKMNKYLTSWVHLYKRKDTRSGLTNREKIERLQDGLKRNPRMFYLYLEMIQLYRAEGMDKEAWIPYVETCYKLFRGNAENMRRLGDRLMEARALELAERAYELSLKANPRQPILYGVLANLYRQAEKDAEALELLEQGQELFPTNPGINSALKNFGPPREKKSTPPQ